MTKDQLKSVALALSQARPSSQKEFILIVRREAGKFKSPSPRKSDLLSAYHSLVKNKKIKSSPLLLKLMTKRGVRTLSGVAVITVLTKPYPCPGKCVFCPTEKGMPKSYLSNEPAVMRAILNDWDPHRQIKMRLRALKENGHATDKIEVIIIGGTWSAHTKQYQKWYVRRCFEALNGKKSSGLLDAQTQNESAKHRCVGLTLETRPDFINEKELLRMRELGCTRVEMGIQHIDDDVLNYNIRGHDVKRSISALRLLREAGFKVNLHFMPDLPGSTPAKDLKMFKHVYTSEDWMPDMVKVYPCVVNPDAELYQWYKSGKYKPYSEKQLHKLLIDIKKITPEYVRITRLIRDIPEESIVAGNSITNLRQLLDNQSKKEGWSCRCIRCREVGRHEVGDEDIKKAELVIRKYRAGEGLEYFMSFESPDKKVLYAFLRLRIDDKAKENFIPALVGAGLVRELHTYGKLVEIGKDGDIQHVGFGTRLMQKAEEICQQNGLNKMAVIAGVGVRKYYEKFDYKLEGTYMTKKLP
jgi:elongator complex protein 3